MRNKYSYRNAEKKLIVFVITFLIVTLCTYISDIYLIVYKFTSFRMIPGIIPVLSIVYGWPAILGCAVGNMVSDFAVGRGWAVALWGFIPQIIYGAFPAFVWRIWNKCEAREIRLDSTVKTLKFHMLMLINCIIVAINCALIEKLMLGARFYESFFMIFLIDFSTCLLLGAPLLAMMDAVYSGIKHHGKRELSINECILLATFGTQIIVFWLISTKAIINKWSLSSDFMWQNILKQCSWVNFIIMLLSYVVMIIGDVYKKKHRKLNIIEKRRGTIFSDTAKHLEFVSFPGMNVASRVRVDNRSLDYSRESETTTYTFDTAWYTDLSSQKGCPMKCKYCDCAGTRFFGNVDVSELRYQMDEIIKDAGVHHTEWFEVRFARMGEITYNPEILKYMEFDMKKQILSKVKAETIFPVVSTVMPNDNPDLLHFLLEFCRIKQQVYNGEASLQFCINTTDEKIRNDLYAKKSMSLEEIAGLVRQLPDPGEVRYSLNFSVNKYSVIDPDVINNLFDKKKCLIRLTPVHSTFNAVDSDFKLSTGFLYYEMFERVEQRFRQLGWDVFSYLETKEEDSNQLTNGNLLLLNL